GKAFLLSTFSMRVNKPSQQTGLFRVCNLAVMSGELGDQGLVRSSECALAVGLICVKEISKALFLSS
ncbi:hypothetical protein, partial [Aeromonas rivipollensis]|uniref:hypothetical protein n=1 Tax=Aeromonas rivipollensis TaxID=948519 RepID=UPI001F44B848